jgi:hypothetical protein
MIHSPFAGKLQAAHQYQGKTNDCGPFCAAITASALGHEDSKGENFVDQLKPVRWKGVIPIPQRIPGSATMPWGTTFLLKNVHLNAKWYPFSSEWDLFTSLDENVIQIIIIGEWHPVWAHYMIFTAYDAKLGYGFVDPAYTTSDIHWYKPGEFLKLWSNYGRIRIKVYPPAYLPGSMKPGSDQSP